MSSSSISRSTGGSTRRQSHSHVPYRQAPLAYEPAKFCLCTPRAKAPMWISWSDSNPGRRYLAYPRGRSFGCGLFQWVDNEMSPFLTQLLLGLRNVVWALEAHNRILDRNVHGWRSPNVEHIQATAST
ncbi:hypothetical protein ACQJBY_068541 [Aegilops geniculata]